MDGRTTGISEAASEQADFDILTCPPRSIDFEGGADLVHSFISWGGDALIIQSLLGILITILVGVGKAPTQ